MTNVRLKDRETGDVIQFYNEVFMERVKEYVFCLKRGQEWPHSSKVVSSFWSTDSLETFSNMRRIASAEEWLTKINAKQVYVFGKSANKKLEKIAAALEQVH